MVLHTAVHYCRVQKYHVSMEVTFDKEIFDVNLTLYNIITYTLSI